MKGGARAVGSAAVANQRFGRMRGDRAAWPREMRDERDIRASPLPHTHTHTHIHGATAISVASGDKDKSINKSLIRNMTWVSACKIS